MHVLFDGFWWVAGPVSNAQVMREFVLAWEREFPDDRLTVAVPKREAEIVRAQLHGRVALVTTTMSPQGISAIVELPFIAKRVGADVTLAHNFTPLFGDAAVFVHDFMFMTNPEWFTRSERAYFALMPATIRRARWVFTSSESEAERISQVAPGRPAVTAVGLGLSRDLESAEQTRPPALEGVRDFLLAVGRLNARKNLGGAIEAAVASGCATPETPLLIVGEPEGRRATFSAAVGEAVASEAVRFLGFVDTDELAWLYAHARVFLFLSLDEGFGMPTLEAAHFGAPVVASDTGVFREILGDHARYADPQDRDAIAAAIAKSWREGRTKPLSAESLGYSWELSARRMREALLTR